MAIGRCLRLFTGLVLALVMPGLVEAGQDQDNNAGGGLQVDMQLRHRVTVPAILYFRVGSATFDDVDRVTFDLSAGPMFPAGNNNTAASLAVPLGNSTPIDATTNGALAVDVRSNVGTVNVSYAVSDPSGLLGSNGTYLPFEQIETVTSDAALPAPVLANAGAAPGSAGSVEVLGNLYSGLVVDRQAIWTYRYRNELIPQAGTYDGRVTYTAAAP